MKFGLFAPKIPKKSPRCSKKCAQVRIFGSKLAILDPSWRQVGDLGRHLHPSCRQDGFQEAFRKVVKRRSFCNPRRNLPKIPKRLPKCPQKARSMLPNVPKSIPKCSKKSNALQSLSDPTYSSTVSVYLLICTWIDLVSSFGAFRSLAVQVYIHPVRYARQAATVPKLKIET